MFKYIRKITFIVRISWAHVSGRWFYLRNEPYDLVKLLAETKPEDCHGEACIEIHRQAKQEIEARDRRTLVL